MTRSVATPSVGRSVRPAVVLIGVLALALNLRAALVGYAPLVGSVREGLGVNAALAGSVQTGSVLMMAVGSLLGPALGRRLGLEHALGFGVVLVAIGSILRGVAALPALVVGSVLIGLGIGAAGVLLAGVVKRHLRDRAGAVTGGYVVAMMVGSTAAGAVAVPLATTLGGWSFSLAVWAVPAVLAVALWAPTARRARRAGSPDPEPETPRSPPWREPFAWWIALYLAGSSTQVYGWLTWLAPYYTNQGWSPGSAGLLVAVWSVAQIPTALLVPAWAERRGRWGLCAAGAVAVAGVGTFGALVVPSLPVVGPWVWVVLIGLAAGAAFPLGLALIVGRTPDAATSAAVSGMGLGIGYTIAGLAPLAMGALIDLTGGYDAAVATLLLAALLQGVAVAALRERRPATTA